MSILKSILHRWNKDSKSYDTLHPETEVAQITDFADGIVSKLAATTAISAISALQTDSWFGKMMKWVLDASGVKYLIDTNGYVCFGSLFGGLIIQWIFVARENQVNNVPLSGYTKLFETAIHRTGATATYITSMKDESDNTLYIASNASGNSSSYWLGLFK